MELLVVMVIIGMLASFVAPRFFGQVDKSAVSVARAQIDAFRKALDAYRLDVGQYPSTGDGLRALVARPAGAERWNGPYLERAEVPVDPWGERYVYRAPGEAGRDFDVVTYGKDRRPGGQGSDADIKSW